MTQIFGIGSEVYFILLIIAIPTFSFLQWVFKKYIKDEKKRTIATWATTIFVTPIIYVGLVIAFISWIIYTPSKYFDKSQWLTNREERFQMADDILESKMLMDKDSNQVKQILGDPDRRGDSMREWTYGMGMGGGFGFLFHNLKLKLDDNGKVISVEHETIND